MCFKKHYFLFYTISVLHESMHFARYWNMFVKPSAAGSLRRKLNHWDMQEEAAL